MKQYKIFPFLFPFIVTAIPIIYLGIVWDDLPSVVPTHFDFTGEADKYGSKNQLLLLTLVMFCLTLGVYLLLRNINRIDPKRKHAENGSRTFSKLGAIIVILLSTLSVIIIYSSIHGKMEALNLKFCFIGLFFVFIGNLLYSIKQNYLVGFRLPWTLESEDNWRKTHQFASKIWFGGGIFMAISALVINGKIQFFIFISLVIIMTIMPCIYSYNLYRQSISRLKKH